MPTKKTHAMTVTEQQTYSTISDEIDKHIEKKYGEKRNFSFDYVDLSAQPVTGSFTMHWNVPAPTKDSPQATKGKSWTIRYTYSRKTERLNVVHDELD